MLKTATAACTNITGWRNGLGPKNSTAKCARQLNATCRLPSLTIQGRCSHSALSIDSCWWQTNKRDAIRKQISRKSQAARMGAHFTQIWAATYVCAAKASSPALVKLAAFFRSLSRFRLSFFANWRKRARSLRRANLSSRRRRSSCSIARCCAA